LHVAEKIREDFGVDIFNKKAITVGIIPSWRLRSTYLRASETRRRSRRKPRLNRRHAHNMCPAASLTSIPTASTNGFRLRSGGMYSVSGAAENATASSNCIIC
ncbi:hypothetical protein GW17_00041385, partial [Ensete ventricosum]